MKKQMKRVATLCLAGITAMSTIGVTGSAVFAEENYDVESMDFDNVELRVAFRFTLLPETRMKEFSLDQYVSCLQLSQIL